MNKYNYDLGNQENPIEYRKSIIHTFSYFKESIE